MARHSKLRSWLTILGIVIGVASVIAIVAIGEGLSNQIQSNLGTLNADIITITPGFSRAQTFGGRQTTITTSSSNVVTLTRKDVLALKTIPQIDLINTKISGNVEISYLAKKGTLNLQGVDTNVFSKISSIKILKGRNLGPSDSNVILIGNNLATKYFEKEILLNQLITIEGKSFRVIGILDDNSNSIIMPINTAYDLINNKEKFVYDSIELKVKNPDNLNETEEIIKNTLMRSRNVNEKNIDFTIRSNTSANTTRQDMINTLKTFLTAIASVSLLVGAVGIANTMFTSVLEKTKEIGIMKAIGARNMDILTIFLLNAGLIGMIGGIIGICLGILISTILNSAGIPSIINLQIIIITLIISIFVGMISGLIPAINASKLKPVDALRRD